MVGSKSPLFSYLLAVSLLGPNTRSLSVTVTTKVFVV